jgi:CHAT domain-containing protein
MVRIKYKILFFFLLVCSLNIYAYSQEATTLELRKTIEQQISNEQIHSYQLNISTGQFAEVSIGQLGADLIVKVFAPDGKLVAEFDYDIRLQGEERVGLFAERDGLYRLDIKPKYRSMAGRYIVNLLDVRTPNEHDRIVYETRRLYTEATILESAAKYEEASRVAVRALELSEKSLVSDKSFIGNLLTRIAFIERTRGNYAKAEELFQRSLAINEKALGREHPQTARAIEGLGLIYLSIDDYVKSEPLLEESVAILEKTLGKEYPTVAACLMNVSLLHQYLGDYDRAVVELQRAIGITEKTLGTDSFLLVKMLNNLGNILVDQHSYNEAEPLFSRGLLILERIYGKEHPHVTIPLQNLGIVARHKKSYKLALDYLWRAEKIREKAYGIDHPQTAALLMNIANVYGSEGKYKEALELHHRALNIVEKRAGTYHSLTMMGLGNLARTYAAQGDIEHAVKYQIRTDEAIEKSISLNLAIGSERQKLAYLNLTANRLNRTISLQVNQASNNPLACNLAAQVVLQRKGRVLDAMSTNLSAIRQRLNPEDQALLDQLGTVTEEMARLAINGPGKMDIEEYHKQLKTLEEKRERLESEISRRNAEFRIQLQPVTLDAVRSAIPENAALIEFATYRKFDPKDENYVEAYSEPRYIAYVIHNNGQLKWKDLGTTKVIDEAVGTLLKALNDPKRQDWKTLARIVDQKVMEPIRPLLGETKHLLISPDGELNLLPFAALVDEDGRYQVEHYTFTYLTSGRDLLRMQVSNKSRGKPLLIANPLFGDIQPSKPNSIAKRTPSKEKRRGVTTANNLNEIYFAPLSGTAEEARSIQTIFPEAVLLSGDSATESALKQSTAPAILHIATHGFFLSESKTASDNSQIATPAIKTNARIENPLLRSGLAFSGANLRNNDNDGILTALEASSLNLWGTQLVVLSACDTGVGEVRNGEGVYGLRRAFVLAGGESLVMSLWPVSDYMTRTLMTKYYMNLKRGAGRGEALRQVQLEMLKQKKNLHPFYWANFIQSGNWTNLSAN